MDSKEATSDLSDSESERQLTICSDIADQEFLHVILEVVSVMEFVYFHRAWSHRVRTR